MPTQRARNENKTRVCLWFFKWFFGTTTKNADLYENGFMHRCHCLCVFARLSSCKYTRSLRISCKCERLCIGDSMKTNAYIFLIYFILGLFSMSNNINVLGFFSISERVIASLLTISWMWVFEISTNCTKTKKWKCVEFKSN